jgi:glutaredoxin
MSEKGSHATPPLVEMFSKADCHLCDHAVETAKALQAVHGFDLRIVKLEKGDPQFEEYKERFPVITVDGRFVSNFRVREDELLAVLSPAAA